MKRYSITFRVSIDPKRLPSEDNMTAEVEAVKPVEEALKLEVERLMSLRSQTEENGDVVNIEHTASRVALLVGPTHRGYAAHSDPDDMADSVRVHPDYRAHNYGLLCMSQCYINSGGVRPFSMDGARDVLRCGDRNAMLHGLGGKTGQFIRVCSSQRVNTADGEAAENLDGDLSDLPDLE